MPLIKKHMKKSSDLSINTQNKYFKKLPGNWLHQTATTRNDQSTNKLDIEGVVKKMSLLSTTNLTKNQSMPHSSQNEETGWKQGQYSILMSSPMPATPSANMSYSGSATHHPHNMKFMTRVAKRQLNSNMKDKSGPRGSRTHRTTNSNLFSPEASARMSRVYQRKI